jgi:RNA polymerase sigma-70 factor (ECF subfamily)
MTHDLLKELVELEREDEPSPERTERGWQRLSAAVAKGGSGTLVLGASKTLKLSAWYGSKWAVIGGIGLCLGGGSYVALEHRVPSPLPVAPVKSGATLPRPAASAAEPPQSAQVPELQEPATPVPAARGRRAGGGGAPGSFEQELALIKAAKAELDAGRAAAALDLVNQHARLFPRGVFAGEREALRALGTCGAGDGAAGRKLGLAFIRAYPTSPLVDRVRRVCGLDDEVAH